MKKLPVRRKRRSSLNARKRSLSNVRNNHNVLRLLVMDNHGKTSAYHVPIEKKVIKRGLKRYVRYELKQSSNTDNYWNIVSENCNDRILIPNGLVNKRITLKKGNAMIKGKVLKATPLSKGPSGNPAPVPPIKR